MGSPSLYSARKTTLALAVALSFAWQAPVFAHGGEAHMVPMDKTLKEFGADVQWDDYAQLFTLIKDGAYVKVKPGAQTAIVNGQPLALQVPVVMKDNKAWVSDTFINDVFQSGLDQTFQVEKRPHPLNALTADEIKQAVEIVKASADFKPNTRFTEISLLPPDKEAVWAFALENKPVDQPRKADVIMLDGKHIIEAVVDLLEEFITSGFSKETAAKMINSALVLQQNDGMFSTVDVCSLDLYTGVCNFLKAGAASTFIRRDQWVETIRSTSMAAGLIQQLDFETSVRKLYDGDYLVMVTDGVLDALPASREEETMKDILLNIHSPSPREFGRAVLEKVLSYCGYRARDDMTVLVAGIWKKA